VTDLAKSILATALVLSAASIVRETSAESVPVAGTIDPRIRTAEYREEEVYRLQGFVGYGLELVFEEGEEFVGQAGGDLEAITFGAHENHVILKPRAANIGTNFVVYTNRTA
jgi:type IV secretion system protein VirB9